MYKKLLLLAVFLMPFVASAEIINNLRYGSVGPEVTELQEFLIDKGFLTGNATGNFYSLTKSAVIKYQSSISLPATGFVGPMTRERINSDLSKDVSEEETQSTPVVTPTSDTKLLQAQLDSLLAQFNAMLEEQKKSTEATQQATRAVQKVVENTAPKFGAVDVAFVPPTVTKELVVGKGNCDYNGKSYVCNFYVKYVEDGYPKGDIPVNVTSDDGGTVMGDTKTRQSANSLGVNIYYYPKQTGIRTITVTANGITKTAEVNIDKPVEFQGPGANIVSQVSEVTNLNLAYDNSLSGWNSIGWESKIQEMKQKGQLNIGSFTLPANGFNESMGVQVKSTKTGGNINIVNSYGAETLNPKEDQPEKVVVRMDPRLSGPETVGIYTVTITEIKLTGLQSGIEKMVQGLPITFTYEVK